MSLFIGSLAFAGPEHIVEMRLGVIGGLDPVGARGACWCWWLATRAQSGHGQ